MKRILEVVETIDVILVAMYFIGVLNFNQFFILFLISTIWFIIKEINKNKIK